MIVIVAVDPIKPHHLTTVHICTKFHGNLLNSSWDLSVSTKAVDRLTDRAASRAKKSPKQLNPPTLNLANPPHPLVRRFVWSKCFWTHEDISPWNKVGPVHLFDGRYAGHLSLLVLCSLHHMLLQLKVLLAIRATGAWCFYPWGCLKGFIQSQSTKWFIYVDHSSSTQVQQTAWRRTWLFKA